MYHNEEELQEQYIALLKKKVPKNLASVLMEILPLGKEAIYRRLRYEVPFTFAEIMSISSHLGISLDNMTTIVSPYRTQSYQLHVRDYNKFTPVDLYMSESYIKVINQAADNPYSEFGIAANALPLHISLHHLPLYRVYLLKWRYQFGMSNGMPLNYSEIQVPEREEETYAGYLKAIERIKYTYFIWDTTFIMSLINDINYFHGISLIGQEDMVMLKQELSGLLNTLEMYTDRGVFPTTGNKVEVYISSLNFDTSYSYLASEDICVSMSQVYGLGAYTSLGKDANETMKNWIQGLKKTATLISNTSQIDRIRYFRYQRSLLDLHFNQDS